MTRLLRRLAGLDALRWRYLCLALGHLLAAKLQHMRLSAPQILAKLREQSGEREVSPPDPAVMHWAIYGIGRRLPWRSDCLIQALAAKRWLDRTGAKGELHLGVRRDELGALTAHAWITLDGEVVSGGPVSSDLAPLSGSVPETGVRWTAVQ